MRFQLDKGYKNGLWSLKIMAAVVILSLLSPSLAYAQEDAPDTARPFPYEDFFVVSAYYSPLPNQTRYVTGSYDGDVRLNGEGVHAADGSIVYPGMIAAPKIFPFGTKIKIEGIGTGTVHDRGGAINGKRLDVWFGYGEEGLRRALGWGMRNVKATVYGPDPNIPEQIDVSKFPMADNVGYYIPQTKYFKFDLGYGDFGDEVYELQRLLKEMGYQDVHPIGSFAGSTRAAILAFQMEKKIITNGDDMAAGLFGPKTRVAFEKELDRRTEELKIRLPNSVIQPGTSGEEVTKLQDELVKMGWLAKSNGTYDGLTADAVFAFQKSTGLMLTRDEFGAGFFGPQTKEAFAEAVLARFIPNKDRLQIPERKPEVNTKLVFQKVLKMGDRGDEVTKLQEELRRFHFLALKPSGNFEKSTYHAVFKFQQAMGIVNVEKDSGAGYVGPRTRDKLNQLISLREAQNRLITETTQRRKDINESM